MGIKERKFGMSGDRVNVPVREIPIVTVDDPVFAAKVEVGEFLSHAHAVRDRKRITSGAVYEVFRRYLGGAADPDRKTVPLGLDVAHHHVETDSHSE